MSVNRLITGCCDGVLFYGGKSTLNSLNENRLVLILPIIKVYPFRCDLCAVIIDNDERLKRQANIETNYGLFQRRLCMLLAKDE